MRFSNLLLLLFSASIVAFSPVQKTKEKPKYKLVIVKNSQELKNVLTIAKPGDSIVLADGIYSGKFIISNSVNGLKNKRIILSGSKKAVLDAGTKESGYVLHLNANYWTIKGITIQNGLKGVVTDNANYNILDDLLVQNLGEEGVHFRAFSSYNVLTNSKITNVGLKRPGFGEGVYIGTAVNNWAKYTNGQPDKCDSNKIVNNEIGPFVTAECIDIKEGTTGGLIKDNKFFSEGMSGENSADSWIDVKGNGYLIEGNVGVNNPPSVFIDGYQVNCAVNGWGNHNVFKGNILEVNAEGFGINVRLKSTKGEVVGNVVYDDNKVKNACKGITNISLSK